MAATGAVSSEGEEIMASMRKVFGSRERAASACRKTRLMGAGLCALLAGLGAAGAAQGAADKEKIVLAFNLTDGNLPNAGLIADANGNLYGTTSYDGGKYGYGNVYQLTHTKSGWKETVLYDFTGGADGAWPMDSLTFDSAGNLYGTAESGGQGRCVKNGSQWLGCGVVFELSPTQGGGWHQTVLFSFVPGQVKGVIPVGGVVFDQAGNLYGTTWAPGVNGGPLHAREKKDPVASTYWGCSDPGCGGTVFELSSTQGGSWQEKDIYAFTGTSDGGVSQANLILDPAGNLYGTTVYGGSGCYFNYGCGVVFELSPNNGGWSESVLHTFSGSDGSWPMASLLFDTNGNLYGTTSTGGDANQGTVFRMTPANGGWSESVLHSFSGADGAVPYAAVIMDGRGNLFGTTNEGGTGNNCTNGYVCGVAFELTPSGGKWKERVLHGFSYPDALGPAAPLLAMPKGRLFGTAQGGTQNGHGAVFELVP